MLSINNVGIHNLSPGMVTTDLLMAGAHMRQQHVWSNMLVVLPTLQISLPVIRSMFRLCRTWTVLPLSDSKLSVWGHLVRARLGGADRVMLFRRVLI